MPRIDHIIAPVDLTDSSIRTIGYAFAWAHWYGARVHVVHVAPPTIVSAPLAGVAVMLEPRPAAELARRVEQQVAKVPNPGVTVDIQVFEGDPPSIIRQQAERYPRAVVVMGAHARTGVERFFLGSVAERVVGGAVAPVLIVPPHDTHAPWVDSVCSRILCAVDMMPSSLEGLRYALSLAKEAGAHLHVISVVEDAAPADDVLTSQHFRVPEYLRYRADEALLELQRAIPDEAREACEIREHVVVGGPSASILRAADETDAELIVMGAGDHAHLRALWLGHATSQIVREARCPILVVPTPVVLRRAHVLDREPVARERWSETLARVSVEHVGDPATVTALEAGYSAPEATALPLIGVTLEQAPQGGISVMLGGPDGAHVSHRIAHPVELRLDESRLHDVTRLLVRDEDGSATLLEVARHVPTALQMFIDARMQF